MATVIEVLAQISPVKPAQGLRQTLEAAALAEARTGYDHLAGRAGVALVDALLESRVLIGQHPDGAGETGPAAGCAPTQAARYAVTEAGAATLAGFGVEVAAVLRSRRRFAGSCLDWTQRRPHLNGALGAAVTARLLQLGLDRARALAPVRAGHPGRSGRPGPDVRVVGGRLTAERAPDRRRRA